MKIALASAAAMKIAAVRAAFPDASIETYKTPSNVSEQPFDGETLHGALNRLNALKTLDPDADMFVAIENGLFQEGGLFIDRAVAVIAMRDGRMELSFSDGVEFPAEAVEEARARGFDQWTVGKVMEEQGIVVRHDDPHATLSGVSRSVYLNNALQSAALKMGPV